MDTQQQALQDLYNNRLIRSREEFTSFENALVKIAENLDNSIIPELLRVFDDNTEHHEVVWGLLHYLEHLDLDAYIEAISRCAPDMMDVAPEWLEQMLLRLVKDDIAMKKIRENFENLNDREKEAVYEIMKRIAKRKDYLQEIIANHWPLE